MDNVPHTKKRKKVKTKDSEVKDVEVKVKKKKKRKPVENVEAEPVKKKKKKKAKLETMPEDDTVPEVLAKPKKKKKKVDVDDIDVAKKKKRKKPSPEKLKARAGKLKSKVDEDSDAIEKELAEHERQKQAGAKFSDNTWLNSYTVMFKKLKLISSNIEDKVLDTNAGNDVYALMALYNQQREVIADLRALMDLSQNTQRIVDGVLYPLVRDIGNNYADVIYLMLKAVRASVDGDAYRELKDYFNKYLSEHAKFIQSSYEKHSDVLAKMLEE